METHGRDCCCTRMQNKFRLPMTDDIINGMGHLIASDHKNHSYSSQLTDGRWFGRASVPDVNDTNVNFSCDHGSHLSHPLMVSSSSGSLVCSLPAVPALSSEELVGEMHHANVAFSQDYSRANQALGRDCQNFGISRGLVSVPAVLYIVF